jgi:hypothetical protein
LPGDSGGITHGASAALDRDVYAFRVRYGATPWL